MKDGFFEQMTDIIISSARGRSAEVDSGVLREWMQSLPVPAAEVYAETAERKTVPPVPAPETGSGNGLRGETDWESLESCVRNCRKCSLWQTRRNTVFGEGNLHAELMFVGEGPGADEDAAGRPFVGRAGQLLDKMIAAMTFAREEVYIANVVKCRPPGNRNPAPEEAQACIGILQRQIALVQPKAIVCLGGVALLFLCGETCGITRARGHWLNFNGIPVMPTFHPAYLLRQESAKRAAWSDLQQVMKLLGRTRPSRKQGS